MQFEAKERYGPARVGVFTINDKKIPTPNILFLETKRCRAPPYAGGTLSEEKKGGKEVTVQGLGSVFYAGSPTKDTDLKVAPWLQYPPSFPSELIQISIDINKKKLGEDKGYVVVGNDSTVATAVEEVDALLFVLSHASHRFRKSSEFIETLVKLRNTIGYQKLLYTPSIAKPNNLALLVYLGVDLIDSLMPVIAARQGYLLSSTGAHHKKEVKEIFCSCSSCEKVEMPAEMSFAQILEHNNYALYSELKHVRNAIRNETLRELVEQRVRSDPSLVEKLRVFDKQHYDFQEKQTPLIRKSCLYANSKEALWRPEVERFRRRLTERYRKPSTAKILLLLPCSAKKPYSFSKSHHMFHEALHFSPYQSVMHEVIVTSPLGVVPRELELMYPAGNYDISVTGDWSEDEKKMIRDSLQAFLDKNQYDHVVAHLPEGLFSFIEDILGNATVTCRDHPTSSESLEKLGETMQICKKDYEVISKTERLIENMRSRGLYQFGETAADELLKDCRIVGRYPYQKIIDEQDEQRGMITLERGLISLTLEGAHRMHKGGQYWVSIDDFIPHGSVLAPGVRDADELIRPQDEVVVLHNDEIRAVGIAQMNGEEMTQSTRGEAVKVRHHT